MGFNLGFKGLSTDCACNCSRLFLLILLLIFVRFDFINMLRVIYIYVGLLTSMLSVPHENQWHGVRRPKQSMATDYENNQKDAIIQVNLLFLVGSTCFG